MTNTPTDQILRVVNVRQCGESEAYHIGTCFPPIGWTGNWQELWGAWRQAEPQPDTDSEFIPWLIEQHGFREGPYIELVEIET